MLRKILPLLILPWTLFAAQSLTTEKFYENYHYRVECKSSAEDSAKELKEFLTKVKAEIQKYEKQKTATDETITMDFIVSRNSTIRLKKILEGLGSLELISFEKIDFEDAIAHGRYQKALLDEMKKEYKQEFKTFHEVKDTQSMRKTIDLIHDTSQDILELQKKIKSYKNDQKFHHYKVVLNTKLFTKQPTIVTADGKVIEANATQEERSVFIPSSAGIGWVLLQVELPSSGFSSPHYSGYDIKYMFNDDEQYAKIVTMDATVTPTNTAQINDLFMLSYGRNFYPLRFRSGKNILTNIYSGVDIGVFLRSTVSDLDTVYPFGTVHIGYELYGNDYFFIDTKVSYFLPLWGQDIINLRGVMYGFSFNLKL